MASSPLRVISPIPQSRMSRQRLPSIAEMINSIPSASLAFQSTCASAPSTPPSLRPRLSIYGLPTPPPSASPGSSSLTFPAIQPTASGIVVPKTCSQQQSQSSTYLRLHTSAEPNSHAKLPHSASHRITKPVPTRPLHQDRQEKRRRNHLNSEKKRRENIKSGMEALFELVPACMDKGESKAQVLRKTRGYVLELRQEVERLQMEVGRLGEENRRLRIMVVGR